MLIKFSEVLLNTSETKISAKTFTKKLTIQQLLLSKASMGFYETFEKEKEKERDARFQEISALLCVH